VKPVLLGVLLVEHVVFPVLAQVVDQQVVLWLEELTDLIADQQGFRCEQASLGRRPLVRQPSSEVVDAHRGVAARTVEELHFSILISFQVLQHIGQMP
jgi:hypothetical protein